MSEPVKIIVTAETAQAAADLARFVSQAGSGLRSLAPAAAASGEALQKMRESSLLLREGMHGVELGAMSLAGTKLPALAEAIMGLRLAINGTRTGAMLFGLTLSEMLLPIAGIAAALGGGWLLWEGYGNHMESAETKAKNLAAALEKLPDILKQISAAQAGGLIGDQQAKKWQDMLSGATPLYRNSGSMGGQDLTTDPNIRNSRTGGVIGTRDEASQDEKQKYVEQQILMAGLNKTQSDAAQQLKEIHDQDAAESLAGVQKKIAAEQDRFQKEMEHIRELHDTAVAAGGKDDSGAAQAALDRHNATIDEINQKAALEKVTAEKKAQAELDKQILDFQKEIEAFIKKNVEEETRLTEEKRKQTAEALKQLELQQAIARSQTEAQLKQIRENPFLNNYDKGQASIGPIQTLMSQNDQSMTSLADTANQPGVDETARLEAMQKINQLMAQQVDLQHQLAEAQDADSFNYQLGQTIVRLQNIGTLAQQSAQAFAAVWQTATNSITKNISGLVDGTEKWGQAMRSIYNSIVEEIVQQIVHMAVQWALQHTIMAAISSIFNVQEAAKAAASQATIVTITGTGAAQRIVIRTGEAAHDATMTAAQVGTHAAGEGQKSIFTMLGTEIRTMWRNIETMAHNIGVAICTMFHLTGETTATAATVAGATTRVAANAAVAGSGAASAVSSTPYVGPILAVAAMAVVIAAVMAACGAFAEGGLVTGPGTGTSDSILARLSHGEYVMPAAAVDRIGVENLAALHHGGSLAAGGGGGGGGGMGKGVSVYSFTDPRQMADHLQKNDDHEKWVVDVMSRHIHKFR